MSGRVAVTPNRRGLKSRELVLDAAERVMSEDGFEAATLARVVEEAGIPMSSVYHYYGSKEGILLAVQPLSTGDGQVREVVGEVRELGLERLRAQIALAFDDDPLGATTHQLARFALAAIDGAFVACQTEPGLRLEDLLRPLAPALEAVRAKALDGHEDQ